MHGVARLSEEETDLQHTRDALDGIGNALHVPDSVYSGAVLAGGDLGFGEKRLEGSVDDVETLVCLDGTGLCEGVFAQDGVDRAQKLQLAHDGCVGDGCDFNGYRGPFCDEVLLVFAVVYGRQQKETNMLAPDGGGGGGGSGKGKCVSE